MLDHILKRNHLNAMSVANYSPDSKVDDAFIAVLAYRFGSDVLLRHLRSHRETSNETPNSSPTAVGSTDRPTYCGNGQIQLIPAGAPPTLTGQHPAPLSQSIQCDYRSQSNLIPMDSNIASAGALLDSNLDHDLTVQPPMEEPMIHISQLPLSHGDLSVTASENRFHQMSGIGEDFSTPGFDLWGMSPMLQHSSWLAGDDFDISAFNTAIATSINPSFNLLPPQANEGTNQESSGVNEGDITTTALQDTNERWFTYIEQSGNPTTGANTPRLRDESGQVDEAYRASLRTKLRQLPYDDFLPSTEYLNLCVRLYFTRFSAIFPIVHPGTFYPAAKNALLLISICSVGSLFLGSPDAAEQGAKIFETLNKCILASWERHISKSGAEVLSVIQACIIGQTFGMLSGDPKHLFLVETFHGSVIAWARQHKTFNLRLSLSLPQLLQKHQGNVDLAWKDWAQCESWNRVALALYIHDAELATIFYHDPFLRHEVHRLPVPSSHRAWSASSAVQWREVMRKDGEANCAPPTSSDLEDSGFGRPSELTQHPDRYYGYVVLESIGATISDSRSYGQMDGGSIEKFSKTLMSWYETYANGKSRTDPYCSMVLWHYTFCRLFANFDLLERAVGRDGLDDAHSCRDEVSIWASSIEAKRCIMHASLVHAHIEKLPMDTEPAIHVPRILFHSALLWFCYPGSLSRDQRSSLNELDVILNIPEFKLLNLKSSQVPLAVKEIISGKTVACRSSAICGLTDSLQRLGHSGIARKFASILAPLTYADISKS